MRVSRGCSGHCWEWNVKPFHLGTVCFTEFIILIGCDLPVRSDHRSGNIGPSCWTLHPGWGFYCRHLFTGPPHACPGVLPGQMARLSTTDTISRNTFSIPNLSLTFLAGNFLYNLLREFTKANLFLLLLLHLLR